MKYSSISRLVIVPVMISITILVGLNAGSIFRTFAVLDEVEHIDRTAIGAEREITSVLNSFKTQVQEWKNVLLRGKKDADRTKYWNRFQDREADIQQALKNLRNSEALTAEHRTLLDQFLRAHNTMAGKYREGYQAFVDSGYDPSVGDSYVRGIDREPAKLLTQLASDIGATTRDVITGMGEDTRSTMWIILSVSIALSVFCVWYVIGRLRKEVIKPTKNIAQSLSALEQNDYTYALDYTSQHELGTVADAVRKLQHKLSESVDLLNQSDKEVRMSVDKLSTITLRISDGAKTQSQVSSTLQSRTNQMRDVSRSLAAIAQQVGAATSQSQEKVSQCHTIFSGANEGFAQLAQRVTESASIVHELQSRSSTILNVVNVINEIADQTNLLALNAAIEAARAGEHGRGFAVVADEVRALAAKTQQSTKEINEILTAFEKDARSAVDTMDSGKALSEDNASQAAVALEQLDSLVTKVQESASVVVALQDATEEQNDILNDVERASTQVVALAEEYKDMAEDSQISDAIKKAALHVSRVVNSLS